MNMCHDDDRQNHRPCDQVGWSYGGVDNRGCASLDHQCGDVVSGVGDDNDPLQSGEHDDFSDTVAAEEVSGVGEGILLREHRMLVLFWHFLTLRPMEILADL